MNEKVTLKEIVKRYELTLSDPVRNFRQEDLKYFIEKILGTKLEFDVLYIKSNGGHQTKKFKDAIKSGKQYYFAGSFFSDNISKFRAKKAGFYSLKDRVEKNIVGEIRNIEVVSTIKIYKTKNYDIFTPMVGQPSARAERNFKKLMDYIKPSGGNIMPIIVNKEYNVIDGNTRLRACKQLGLPVKFQILETDYDKEVMKMMNASNKGWSQENFIEFYATAYENEDYIKLKKFVSNHHYSIGVYAPLESKLNTEDIRNGNVKNIDYDRLGYRTELLTKFLNALGIYVSSKLQVSRALKNIIDYDKEDTLDYEKFFKRVTQHIDNVMREARMNRLNHQAEILIVSQKAYNQGLKTKRRIYDDLA